MRTLTIIIGLGVIILSVGIIAQPSLNWFKIYIPHGDMRIDLGIIDGSCYKIKNDSWCTISDGKKHKVRVSTTNPGGLRLTVTASDTGINTIDDLSDFQIRGGNLSNWTGLGSEVTLITTANAGSVQITDIKYRYQADENDAPGAYQITLTYTLTAP